MGWILISSKEKADRATYQRDWYRNLSVERQLLRNARARANDLKLPFTLTEKDVVIPDVCPVLGFPLKKQVYKSNAENRGAGRGSPSIDRILPELGYVPGNIRVISARANRLKCDCVDPHELRKVADYIEKSLALDFDLF